MRVGAIGLVVCGWFILGMAGPAAAEIPYFARKYGLDCVACHVQPPKLNEFGEAFRERGYRMQDRERRATVPLAIWASARSDAFPDEPQVRDAVRAYVNKLEVISGGQAGVPWLSYFVEWRPVSLETQRRDGEVRLRDRSGRFEDIFVTASVGSASLTVGQFRQIEQVDVSLRLGLSEPLVFSAALPGGGEGSVRQRSLRGFAPSGRSPSVRLGWGRLMRGGWDLTASAAVPVPGEFSIPLTSEARVEASNEIEWRPKGVVLESFLRHGLTTFGGHLFYDDPSRYLVQGVTTGHHGPLYWAGVLGLESVGEARRGRWSAEVEVVPQHLLALGSRIENRAGDGAPPALVPYVRTHFPGRRYTLYIGIEQRIQRNRNATLVELGTAF